MAKKKEKIVLFAAIERDAYEQLRFIKFKEKKSLAQITREAIEMYLKSKKEKECKFDRCYGF